MIALQLLGIGLIGPGLNGWHASIPLLKKGTTGFQLRETVIPVPTLLSANVRRRTTRTIKLSIAAAEQAADDAGIEPGELATVFASSLGDMQIADNLCRALATEDRPVSPTQFHNSVHNAPAGYWSIATGSRHPSTSLAAADACFSAALLEAALQSRTTRRPVMIVVYDSPAPFPLDSAAPMTDAFAVSIVVQTGGESPRLTLSLDDGEETTLDSPDLEKIRLGSPAARVLPLLQAVTGREASQIILPYLDRKLTLNLTAT